MNIIVKSILSILFLTSIINLNGQVNYQKFRKTVLVKEIVDSLFVFGKWSENGGEETHLKYLGQVTTTKGQIFKILNYSWHWGLSHRATSRILVFNGDNQYLGNYYVTMIFDLPTKMEDGKLIFRNTDGDCDKNLVTVIDLKNGLPKRFFRKCKGKMGDIYDFGSE